MSGIRDLLRHFGVDPRTAPPARGRVEIRLHAPDPDHGLDVEVLGICLACPMWRHAAWAYRGRGQATPTLAYVADEVRSHLLAAHGVSE